MEAIIWLYIIRSEQGKYYTGITNDIERRMREHRSGAGRSTRSYRGIELVWMKTFRERKEAREWEVLVKKKGAGRWLKVYGGVGEMVGEEGEQKKKEAGVSKKEKKEKGREKQV